MKFIIALTTLTLSACAVNESKQSATPKSLATAIANACYEEYEYRRYVMEGSWSNQNTRGKKVTMNFKFKKEELDEAKLGNCDFTEVEVCVDGQVEKLKRDHEIGTNTFGDDLFSSVDSNNRFDSMRFRCGKKGKINISYKAGNLISKEEISLPGTTRFYFGEDSLGNEAGRELDHYQNSECWPETPSECREQAGSGQ